MAIVSETSTLLQISLCIALPQAVVHRYGREFPDLMGSGDTWAFLRPLGGGLKFTDKFVVSMVRYTNADARPSNLLRVARADMLQDSLQGDCIGLHEKILINRATRLCIRSVDHSSCSGSHLFELPSGGVVAGHCLSQVCTSTPFWENDMSVFGLWVCQ